jgi:hypothetical protein
VALRGSCGSNLNTYLGSRLFDEDRPLMLEFRLLNNTYSSGSHYFGGWFA